MPGERPNEGHKACYEFVLGCTKVLAAPSRLEKLLLASQLLKMTKSYNPLVRLHRSGRDRPPDSSYLRLVLLLALLLTIMQLIPAEN